MNYSEWAFHDIEPVYLQIIQKFEYSILSKQLSAGEKLPSVREMAKLLHVSSNTVMKAYKFVNKSGLTTSEYKWILLCNFKHAIYLPAARGNSKNVMLFISQKYAEFGVF